MTTHPPALEELIHDPHTQELMTRFLEIARDMERTGAEPRFVCRALAAASIQLANDQRLKWDDRDYWVKRFFMDVGAKFIRRAHEIERTASRRIDERKVLEKGTFGTA